MGKAVFIAEKPSVAREFAKALGISGSNRDGYIENDKAIVTWCVGHLVTMSYPEVYDIKYKRWSLNTLPFLPEKYLYEVIPSVKKQFGIVSGILKRGDVDTVYVCTDSGREGEYIYRLVEQEAGVSNLKRFRVWIDSQTEEEIKRGVKEAKDLSEYDNLAAAAYLRAKEDYLMGINFSRALTLRFGDGIARFLNEKYSVVSVGRVMTCVLGMVVNREREIRAFKKTPFYRVLSNAYIAGSSEDKKGIFNMEWKAVSGSKYFETPFLYKENGFKEEKTAKELIENLINGSSVKPEILARIAKAERKTEKKNPPLLYNLAELQNDCSKLFKISPDETLKIAQELYEKKLTTYPRTDARVLSSAVAKVIDKNLRGLTNFSLISDYAKEILDNGSFKSIAKSRYVNDKQITDHYAIIPTGQGLSALTSVSATAQKVYEIIVRRFLAIFYGPTVYQKLSLDAVTETGEHFFAGFKIMTEEGYRKVTAYSFINRKNDDKSPDKENKTDDRFSDKRDKDDKDDKEESEENQKVTPELLSYLKNLKKGSEIYLYDPYIKEGETSPPKRYNSGSLILAMENAGQLIEDEELRAQIKGSGIGTSATRAEILKKLVSINYLALNKKTQIITPKVLGEIVYEVVKAAIPPMLNPTLTASWEKGLTQVANGEITEAEYMEKLNSYVARRTDLVKGFSNTGAMGGVYLAVAQNYKK